MNNTFEPEYYNLVFYNNVCHVCKQSEKLQRCSQCKSISYCSKQHQKLDWKGHKSFCNAMCTVKIKTNFMKRNNFEEFIEVKKLRYLLLKKELGRELQSNEMHMWMHPRFCEVCFSENVKFDCPKCKNVSFCSENHRNRYSEQHSNKCDELKLVMEIDLNVYDIGLEETNIIESNIPNVIQKLPDNILDFIKLYDKNSTCYNINIPQNIIKFRCLSPVTSILYGLEKCGILTNRLLHTNELYIHIVGADLYELSLLWKLMSEVVFHWITNLTHLEYFIIGPELSYNGTTNKYTKQLCDSCKNRNITTKCTYHTQLYHNIVNILKKPDIIVCFNSGLHVNSTKSQDITKNCEPEHQWEDSIDFLIQKNIPLILTAFTLNELNSDIDEIKKYAKNDIKVLVEPHKNPFCDRKPVRNFESQREPVFYLNGYISVLIST